MDEKTIPLQKYEIESRLGAADKVKKKWGDDLHYRALFEQTSECVFIIGLDFRYLAVNHHALNLLGYEEQELIGMPVRDVMSQDDFLGHDSLFINDESNLYERILKRKDGSTLPVEVSTSIVYDENAEPAYIQSIARDISERKNAEWILKRHTRILSVIGDATARLLRSSSIEIKIPEVLQSLGLAMDVFCCAIFEIDTFTEDPFVQVRYKWQLPDETDFDISSAIGSFIPELLKLSNGYFSSCGSELRGASFSKPTFVAMPINGNLGSWGFLGFFDEGNKLSWSPSELDAAQTAANLIGSALQRNRYEETIRLNETRNRIILEALPDLLIRIDVAGTILDYSANSDHPLYIHRDMITGKKFSQVWPQETVKSIIGEANENSFTSPCRVDEFRLPYSNHAYEARLYPISSREALIVIRDITEQARLNEMKSDFINRASHELRTPLTTAMLMTELIQEGGTSEELDEYWHTLKSELNRQKILIDRLLIAGRLESGMMKLEIEPMDIIPVLEESLIAVKPIAAKGKVSLSLAAPQRPVRVVGDKSGLQQVFINLINNAVKFSRQGGTVSINVSENETEVVVDIMDSGVGIPEQAIPHLFERFYRAKNVTIAEIPGSGIGLYIVKSIVEELGGSIRVDSVLNLGTTFAVNLKRFE
ncbi:MAG TPA: PAS domain S-box protein [Anaerolineales bacterium]|nr:PAS domain S-box protein [Anaerolineales bacterium]